jgi:lambda family phage portal protein
MKLPEVKQNLLDRAIGYFSPAVAAQRYQARMMMAIAGGYTGARRDRRQTLGWATKDGDADEAILTDLPDLRARSRDLERNAPLAAGAINTKVTSIVGTGLKPRASICRDILKGLTEEQLDAWERRAELEFKLATYSDDFDIERGHSFLASQDLVLRSTLSAGDIFVNLPRKARPGNPYTLRVNFIEADRVCNPQGQSDTATLVAGVEKDADGAPIRYHVAKFHPGNLRSLKTREWTPLDAYDKAGRRQVLHIYRKLRPGQTRGVPDLAAVIELLKQYSKYTDHEIQAAVVRSLFTVFVRNATGTPNITMPGVGGSTQSQKQIDTKGMELGAGAVIGLLPNEDVTVADPKGANNAAEAFLRAMAEQVGAAIEIPVELLLKHFTASYSASRAALLEAWRFFLRSRTWLVDEYCQPIWELVITEAIARGRLSAPGFFTDPLIRMAYLGCEWTGDSMGQLNPIVEVKAAELKVAAGFSTEARETAALNGGDWERDEQQRAKERKIKAGVPSDVPGGETSPAVSTVADFETAKQKADAYGVAVRAGALTPQFEDEESFRKEFGMPPATAPVKDAWEKDGKVRRPITIRAGDAFEAEQDQVRAEATKDPDAAKEEKP